MITAQEVFDRTVRHLHMQGGPAMGVGGQCQYLGDNGVKCAVGYWIPDDKYDLGYEGCPIFPPGDFPERANVREALPPDVVEHCTLLIALQDCHDEGLSECGRWISPKKNGGVAYRLSRAATQFKLSKAIVRELWP